MKYIVRAKGDFQNVKHLYIEQNYSIVISCTNCGEKHSKHVLVSDDNLVSKEYTGKVNLIVKCKMCDREMCIRISDPKGSKKHIHCGDPVLHTGYEEIQMSLKDGDTFIVSELDVRGCFVKEVSNVTCNIISESNKLFKDVRFVENGWVGSDQRGNVTSIEGFMVEPCLIS
ncbi:uncharacterized protein ECU01_0250-like [Nylanderia fulva]|uniref:uncharacterized protein ECU01_0250-like n=1 Tax=Nylanderia fulva TaxID=613905 RepID=UPI0010FB34D4|nr:uncharacterized protein ECU01_0250-like [Nylanderia fulva]